MVTTRTSSRWCSGTVFAITLLVAVAGVSAQDPELFFSGLVVDNLSSRPLEGAMVTIVARELESETGENGQFLFEGIAPGPAEIRFEATGYVTVVEQVEIMASEFIQVRLDPLAAVLDELLIVAGRRPRNTASDLAVPLGEQQGKSVLDLLAEFPGITVSQGGGMATGAFVFIRGVNSFRADMAPMIYMDGVQIDNRQTGRQSIHNLADIPAEAVARIRVLKGPEAFVYPMGANGVILIETHRGGEPTPGPS